MRTKRTQDRTTPRTAIAKRAGCFHHGDLRRALLEAAMAQLEREGPLGVGLRAAARAARVSQTAPYRHFPDKEAMLAALAEQGFHELGEQMAEAARAARDSGAALAALGETYVAFATEHPQLFRLMFGPQVADKQRCPGVSEQGMRAYQVLEQVLQAGQRAGVVPPGDVADLALLHWSLVHGLASLIVDGRLADRLAAAGRGGVRAVTRRVIGQLDVVSDAR